MPQFSDPDDLQKQLLAMVAALVEAATAGASPPVMASWGTKADAARAVLNGTADAGQMEMIAIEAAMTGEKVDDLCARIDQRARGFRVLVATIEGTRRMFSARIATAKPDELDTIFAEMIAAFEQMKAAF